MAEEGGTDEERERERQACVSFRGKREEERITRFTFC